MAIVKSKNKKTGITYVYESESYWDPDKKQPRNHRTLIGKLDDDGNIIPTGSRGRKRKDSNLQDMNEPTEEMESSLAYYQDQCRELGTKNIVLQEQIRKLEKEKSELLSNLRNVLDKYQ